MSLAVPGLTRQLTSFLDDQITPEIATLDTANAKIVSLMATSSAVASLPSLARAYPAHSLSLKWGLATDIGGGAVNQDAADAFEIPEENCVVFAIYDGHGRELGEMASKVAKESIRSSLTAPGFIARLRVGSNTKQEFIRIFQVAHEAIKSAFRAHYEAQGCEVQDAEGGKYLIKRPSSNHPWSCTHGGTTATVVLVLDGWRLIVANVGDSTALWGGVDADEAQPVFRELSADHSPESPAEFARVRSFRPSPTDPTLPEMKFVYDAPSSSKASCPPIFDVQRRPGEIVVTGNGRYYKNVRSEWATLITTPPTAKYQDALAFTRSLGDLHLHAYGTSCVPDVQEFDLCALHAATAGPPPGSAASLLLVCSDGVWDNWKYADVVGFALGEDMTSLSDGSSDGVKATNKLMALNMKRAKDNFGSQADNMTAILCHLRFAPTAA